MKITWLGHACFKVETKDCTVILDPYTPDSVPGLGPVREKADLVLCSHEHFDHNGRDCVILSGKEPAITVNKVETFHDDAQGSLRGPNTIHILEGDGVRVAHLGDLGCELAPEQKAQLTGLDAVMIPVGGFFTVDGKQAAALVKAIQPKRVIPMHYRSDRFGYDKISTVDEFIRELDSVALLGGVSELSVHELPPAQVLVLRPQNLK